MELLWLEWEWPFLFIKRKHIFKTIWFEKDRKKVERRRKAQALGAIQKYKRCIVLFNKFVFIIDLPPKYIEFINISI